jgi:hypothetical protein
MLRRISEPKRRDVSGVWRKVNIEDIQILCFSHYMKDEMDVTCSADDDIINAHKISVCKSNSKRPLQRHRHSWKKFKILSCV